MKKFILALLVLLNCGTCTGVNTPATDQIIQKDTVPINQETNGLKQGLWRTYHKNGNLKSESIYKNNKKEGLSKEWWENGALATEGMYVNDKANGLMNWYNEKGHLVAYGNMTKGKRNGQWRISDWQDESFYTIGTFIMDQEDGGWNSYYGNGQIARASVWKAGKIFSAKCWNEQGAVKDCD